MSAKAKKRVDVILSDVHGLFRDKRAVDAALRVAEKVEPNRIILNGDVFDFPTISKYDVDPARLQAWSVQREVKAMVPFLQTVDEMSPEPVEFLMGNHDWRIHTYFQFNAPRVHELYKADFRTTMRIPERWNVKPYRGDNKLRIGKLAVTHGDVVRPDAGMSAATLRRKYGGNVLCGHSHRLGFVPFTDNTGTFGAWENGHLSMPPHYADATQNWQSGFSVVTTHANGEFVVELVPVVKGRAFFRGDIL